jgi:hypothetical protein
MRPTRNYSGEYLVQRVVHGELHLRVERAHGADQNFEWVARNRFITFVSQSKSDASPICPGSLSSQVPTGLKGFNGL